jgi:hypothetical protein
VGKQHWLASLLPGSAIRGNAGSARTDGGAAAENLAEEIDLLGPVRARAVEEAQTKIVATIRAMEAQGELTLDRGDDDLVD